MKLVKSLLLGSAAGLTVVGGVQAADLPVKKAAPVEYVRVCSAYGAGFFYIPGTDTCLRVSGRARFEGGYQQSYSRRAGNGDNSFYRGQGRFNLDARTQTAYGTLRAFVRLDVASRTGVFNTSGTQQRIANAFPALGQDQSGRTQTFVSLDKAFIQFAGLTAGRASSFFDFYAHDFEFIGATGGSDVAATNLLAYTAKFADGWSATLSIEDPNFRHNTIYGPGFAFSSATNPGGFAFAGSPQVVASPVAIAFNPVTGAPTAVGFTDVGQRSRLPDFVGALRYDAAWGSAQISGAVKEVSTGLLGAATATAIPAGSVLGNLNKAPTEYGWAVQGGVKVNLPFIAAGDSLYIQGAYGEGATVYTGYSAFNGTYTSSSGLYQGSPFNNYFSDAALNPITNKLDLSTSFTVVGSYLHYWSPEWRSAIFGSYGELEFGKGTRAGYAAVANLSTFGGLPANPTTAVAGANFALSNVARDTSQYVVGGSLIWSPVRDLDIGVEGVYLKSNLKSGRAANADKTVGSTTVAAISPGGALLNSSGNVIATTNSDDIYQIRMRIQRDF